MQIIRQHLLSTDYIPSTVLSNVEDNAYFIHSADQTCLWNHWPEIDLSFATSE